MYIFLMGNVSDGFEAIGPYDNADECALAHDGDEGWMMATNKPKDVNEGTRKVLNLRFTVEVDQTVDSDAVVEAVNSIVDTALSTDGILDRFGNVQVGPIE